MFGKRHAALAAVETWTPGPCMSLIRSKSLGELVGYANRIDGHHVYAGKVRCVGNADNSGEGGYREDVTDALIRTATMPLLTLGPVLDMDIHIADAQSVIFLPQKSYLAKYIAK